MITQPSIPRLLESIRDELTGNVLPLIDDSAAKVNVEMMTAVLNALVVRTEHEIEWMLAECAAIEAAATDLVAALADTDALGDALAALQANRDTTMRLGAVADDYQRASEVLSVMAETAYAAGDADAIERVQALVDDRLATEQAAIGEFIAVGRD